MMLKSVSLAWLHDFLTKKLNFKKTTSLEKLAIFGQNFIIDGTCIFFTVSIIEGSAVCAK